MIHCVSLPDGFLAPFVAIQENLEHLAVSTTNMKTKTTLKRRIAQKKFLTSIDIALEERYKLVHHSEKENQVKNISAMVG